MQEPAESGKWERKKTVVLKASATEKVWPLLADFCNLHKIFPKLATCFQVGGVSGQPGLIRYCDTPTNPADKSTSTRMRRGEAKEKEMRRGEKGKGRRHRRKKEM
ncbi:hypothetical protein TB1_013574 [Malus domestica]